MEKKVAKTGTMIRILIKDSKGTEKVLMVEYPPAENQMWPHDCPVEGQIAVGKGEECNWCGAKEKRGKE